jgi:hypothetical protein
VKLEFEESDVNLSEVELTIQLINRIAALEKDLKGRDVFIQKILNELSHKDQVIQHQKDEKKRNLEEKDIFIAKLQADLLLKLAEVVSLKKYVGGRESVIMENTISMYQYT